MNSKTKIILSGISGLLAVAIGAFGAHGLKPLIDDTMMEIFRTGVMYHLIHSAVLLTIALSGRSEFNKAYLFIFIGIILFSFSLYIYSVSGLKYFALITPFGGISFIIGWILIIYSGIKRFNMKEV